MTQNVALFGPDGRNVRLAAPNPPSPANESLQLSERKRESGRRAGLESVFIIKKFLIKLQHVHTHSLRRYCWLRKSSERSRSLSTSILSDTRHVAGAKCVTVNPLRSENNK